MSQKKNKTFIIAEIAQGHDGSLGLAHSYIDAVAKTNVDAIKFQTHIAEEETTHREPWRIKFSKQDKTRYDYWKRMEFTIDEWKSLKQHCDDVNLNFLSSPFSLKAVEILKEVGVHSWKIASGEINNDEIFDSIAETNKKIMLSTGMSTIEEIDKTVQKFEKKGLDYVLMQCTSLYPTPVEKIGLNLIEFFKKRYKCKVGLSDHSGIIYTGFAAATLGIDVLEVHTVFDKRMFGPDVSSSISIDELKMLNDGIKHINTINDNPVDKNSISSDLDLMNKIFRKSIVAKKKLSKNTLITRDDIAFKKPGDGISPQDFEKVIGKKLMKEIEKDALILMENLI